MKDNLKSILFRILAIFLVFSGAIGVIATFFAELFAKILEFATWLFLLEYTQSEISLVGEIVVRILTFAITFTSVRLLFGLTGWWNSKAMQIVYWVISTIVSFGLSYVVMLLEQHIVTILIVLAIVAVVVLAVWLTVYFVKKKKEKAKLEVAN